jgi:hypothetical protein
MACAYYAKQWAKGARRKFCGNCSKQDSARELRLSTLSLGGQFAQVMGGHAALRRYYATHSGGELVPAAVLNVAAASSAVP